MTDLSELERWLLLPRETARLEFKEAKSQFDNTKLFRYCVAIANEGGGRLVLGVTDRQPRQIVGTQAFNDLGGISDKILDVLRFRVDAEEIVHPLGRIVIFHIPPRPRGTAYSYEGAYWMRSDDALKPMTEDYLRKIFAEGSPEWELRPAAQGCSGEDVVQLLDTQSYFDLVGVPYPESRGAVLDRFSREKLVVDERGWTITNLGAVLFAKRLRDFETVWRKAPRVVMYHGTSKQNTRIDQPGERGYAVGFEGLISFINGLVPANEVIGQALRQEVKLFPEIAIRELVANALIHQDFSEAGTSVMVEIYADRIEISSPGQPFISPDRFIDEYQSRNERLADLMRRLRICEEKGSGIDKVVGAAEVMQLPAPDFRSCENRTISVLFDHREFADMTRDDRVRACYQHCVLRYLMNNRMTNQSLRERFGLPNSKSATASIVIAATIDAGKIRLDDAATTSKRYARYVPHWAG